MLGDTLPLRYRSPALVDDPNTSENQYHRYTLLPSEVVQTNDDADDGGDNGLYIIVHANQGGSQAFLPNGDEEIGDESGEKHHESDLPRHRALYLSERYAYQVFDIEGYGYQHGKQEHPLHEGDHIVFRDERAENAEIEGEGQTVDDHEDDAQGFGFGSTAAQSYRVENQDQNASQTHQNATHFLEGDRLLQDDGRHNHGQDGRAGVGDARVDGGRHGDGLQETPLGEKQTQHGGYEDLPLVVQRNIFLGHKERQEPKQQRGTRRTKAKQVHGGHYMRVGDILAANDVEPEDAVGTETSEMPRKR